MNRIGTATKFRENLLEIENQNMLTDKQNLYLFSNSKRVFVTYEHDVSRVFVKAFLRIRALIYFVDATNC